MLKRRKQIAGSGCSLLNVARVRHLPAAGSAAATTSMELLPLSVPLGEPGADDDDEIALLKLYVKPLAKD